MCFASATHNMPPLFPFPLSCLTALLLCFASQHCFLLSLLQCVKLRLLLGLSQPSLSSGEVVSSHIPPCSARTVARITGMVATALSYGLTAPHSRFLHPCLHGDLCPLKKTRLEGCSLAGPRASTAPGPSVVERDLRLPVISFPALKHSADEGPWSSLENNPYP